MKKVRKYKLIILILSAAAAGVFCYYNYFYSNITVTGKVIIPYEIYHVQGLAVTKDYYIISSVDIDEKKGWIYKIDRTSLKLISKKDITEDLLYHPGGIHFDGRYLWVCLSKYSANSKAKIIAYDIDSLEEKKSFYVDDHISFIVSDSRGRLYGANWASKYFYVFDWRGNTLKKVHNKLWNRDYQDGSFLNNKIIVGCQASGKIDVLDPTSFELISSIRTKHVNYKDSMTREGFSVYDNELYLMPEDGSNSKIYICKEDGENHIFQSGSRLNK